MSYRVVHYINQFFANVGGEEMAHIAPELREGKVGPGLAFEQQWKGEAVIVNTIVCGDSYFAEHEKEAKEQVLNWVKEIKPDLFIAGPAFNAGRYGYACANIALEVKTALGIPVLTGMYKENPGADMKDKILIVETTNSAAGMRKAAPTMAKLALKLLKGDTDSFKDLIVESAPELWDICKMYFLDSKDAGDALSDAYVAISENLGDVKETDDFMSWAKNLVHGVCAAKLGKTATATDPEAKVLDLLPLYDYKKGYKTENKMTLDKVLELKDRFLKLLPAQQRAEFLLWIEGFSVVDIAKKLGIPYAAAIGGLNLAKAALDADTLKKLDDEYELLASEGATESQIEASKKEMAHMEGILGAPETIDSLCNDILKHYEENRQHELTGKAMIVAYSRPIAMKIYEKILELRPDWTEKVKVIMTGGNNDPEEWHEIVGNKQYKKELAKKFKDDNDPMKIAIVVDMWLTGFDVPSMATMYVYKPMHGYNLMQAIARVNRVFQDKEGGLVVDYVGIASALKAAMKEYSARDRAKYGDMNIAKVAYPKFVEKLQVCKDLLHGFDFSGFQNATPLAMAKLISGGVNFVLDPKKPDLKDLFLKEALLLRQAQSLCSSLISQEQRHDAAFMEAVRSTVMKLTIGGKGGRVLSLKEINDQINELLKSSIQSEGVISLFDSKTVGEKFSLFDPNVLEEISKMKEKNIAVELLKKLLAERIHVYQHSNLVQSQKFSEMLNMTLSNYLKGMLTNEEVIEELLKMAKEIAAAENQANELGLSKEEKAFYDALTRPRAVQDFYTNDQLVEMTKELTEALRKNRTIDWQQKASARAGMRRLIKRLLKKYKYPPEEEQNAMDIVLKQCEQWADVEPEYVYGE